MLVNFNLEGLEKKDVREIKYLLQEINDKFESGITTRNLANFMNTYVINEKDSLDASYPMYVHFNIINEMINIISVKVSFWILNYRAYSTAASSGGAVSSASGGGETPTTSNGGGETPTSSSGGGQTSAAAAGGVLGVHILTVDGGGAPTSWVVDGMMSKIHTHTVVNHTHTVTISDHTHTVTVAAHTHTGGAHAHNITYGVHEEENSPTIKFYISDTGEDSYSNTFFGGYTADKANINITDYITSAGSKMIKFTSTTRTRLSVQIEVKLAITTR